jgi:hypothetical protein
LIVPADGHGETEPDNQGEEPRSISNDAEIVSLVGFERSSLVKQITDICREPLRQKVKLPRQ